MAVGFEFATGWDIHRLRDDAVVPTTGIRDEAQMRLLTTSFPKAYVVKAGLGWSMTVDGTEIEYVVDQVEESDAGKLLLTARMADLLTFTTMMNLRRMQSFLTARDFPPGTFLAPRDRFVIHIKHDLRGKAIEAIPQVTGGIRLARIRKLWRILSDPNSRAAKQFFAETTGGAALYSGVIRQVTLRPSQLRDSNWAGHTPSAKLRGLVTMIATYLQRGYSPRQNGVGAAKYLFILMSRTKFSALFSDLPSVEKTHYRQHPDQWVSYICREVMAHVPAMGPHGIDPAGRLIERRITDRGALGHNPILLPITRNEWLRGMLVGRDLLSAAAHPLGGADNATWEDSNPELGHRLRGLAGLGNRMDRLQYQGRENKAAIIEFRARQATLAHTLWPGYADRMHKFFTEVNEGARHGVIDLDAPPLAV
ncbi:hypothetical protein [Bryobacter aggregatus]|uniref:hypothetical protein n=1 Tax=Bryobacter aggregatus TaxID=360054 RepID=UPI0004E237C2|nr:hypothetical protein [Bryobacter aggregatus]